MRKNGENIRERADGRWEARIVLETPKGGKTRFKYVYAMSYQEVKDKKEAFLRSLAEQREISQKKSESNVVREASDEKDVEGRGALGKSDSHGNGPGMSAMNVNQPHVSAVNVNQPAPSSLNMELPDTSLFRDVCLEWLAYKKPTVKDSTIANYTVMMNNHILPDLGDLRVTEVTSERLSDYLLEKKTCGSLKDGKPLKNKTVSDLKAILKQILSYAQNHGLIEQMPTCPAVSAKQPPITVLTKAEQAKIEEVVRAQDNTYSLGVILSLYGGLRIGEVCGLRWDDFDFQNGTVSIRRTVARIVETDENAVSRTKIVITPPKTECSARTIPLPASAFQYLSARRGDGANYVITGTDKVMEPRSCLRRFQTLLKRAGVASHTFHSLRHTFATRCIENGVDVKSLSEIMGHSDVKITMQRYVHPSMDFKQEQLNKLPCFGENA